MAPPPAEDDAFARALAAERLHNGRRLAWLRLLGISGFFVLTVVAGRMLDPTWSRSIALFAVYWLIAVGLLGLSYRHGAPFPACGELAPRQFAPHIKLRPQRVSRSSYECDSPALWPYCLIASQSSKRMRNACSPV